MNHPLSRELITLGYRYAYTSWLGEPRYVYRHRILCRELDHAVSVATDGSNIKIIYDKSSKDIREVNLLQLQEYTKQQLQIYERNREKLEQQARKK